MSESDQKDSNGSLPPASSNERSTETIQQPASVTPAGLPNQSHSNDSQKKIKGILPWIFGISIASVVLFFAVSGGKVLMNRQAAKTQGSTDGQTSLNSDSLSGSLSRSLTGSGRIGVLEINGAIMDSKKALKALRRFEASSEIKGVLLRVNSPGGSVAPSQEIYDAVRRFPKPIVASMGSVAASGGFYIAMGAKKIYANAGTLTGSIGVIMQFANLKKLYDWAKVERYALKTGKFKDSGADYRDMSEEERLVLQKMIDQVLTQFKGAVASSRKLDLAKVTEIADGRIFSGEEAFKLGLVDGLGGIDDALADLGEQTGLGSKPKLSYPEAPRPNFLEFFMEDSEEDAESESEIGTGGSVFVRALEKWVEKVTGVETSRHMGPGIYVLWPGV